MSYCGKFVRFIYICSAIVFVSAFTYGQTCATGSEVTAPAGGSVTVTTNLNFYNSTEAGPDSALARTAVDLQDDAWRTAVLASFPTSIFNTWVDTTTAQGNVAVPVSNAFLISGVNVSYDYRDFPTDFRTVAAPCIGSQIATVGERLAFLAKTNPIQGTENAPRPASLYNTANQPLIYDEIAFASQPNRNTTINAAQFTFSTAIRAFGVWFGDTESRTDGGGDPMVVRMLDAAGNRIGSDVLIQPLVGVQTACGAGIAGCGNQTTRWIGFRDTATPARVRQMVVIIGSQSTAAGVGGQRVAFIGPTIPISPTAASATISGRITSAAGRSISDALITLESADQSTRRVVRPNTFGYYNFTDVAVGASYVISISSRRHRFEPSSRVISLVDELNGVDFVSLP